MLDRFFISDEDWQQTPAAVQQAFTSLFHQLLMLEMRAEVYEHQLVQLHQQVAQVKDLKAQLDELRERLSQNSNNSSKPLPLIHHINSRPPLMNRKRESGADKLVIADSLASSKLWLKMSCAECGHLLLGDDPDAARHQVSEVPRCKARIIEYRRHSLRCLACGKISQADWPEAMPQGSFGPRAQALVAYLTYLTGRLTASHRDAAEAI